MYQNDANRGEMGQCLGQIVLGSWSIDPPYEDVIMWTQWRVQTLNRGYLRI